MDSKHSEEEKYSEQVRPASDERKEENSLHRALSAGQISMIAIGTAVSVISGGIWVYPGDSCIDSERNAVCVFFAKSSRSAFASRGTTPLLRWLADVLLLCRRSYRYRIGDWKWYSVGEMCVIDFSSSKLCTHLQSTCSWSCGYSPRLLHHVR